MSPLKTNFDLLNSNLQGLPVSFYNVGIGDVNEIKQLTLFKEKPQDCQILKFSTFLKISNLTKIDFMKSDCEGCEYDIYTNENIEILKKIPKLVGEFHLSGNDFKNKFRYFRDNILNQFSTFEVFSVDGCDIKYWFYTDEFIDFYTEIILHIQNYEEINKSKLKNSFLITIFVIGWTGLLMSLKDKLCVSSPLVLISISIIIVWVLVSMMFSEEIK